MSPLSLQWVIKTLHSSPQGVVYDSDYCILLLLHHCYVHILSIFYREICGKFPCSHTDIMIICLSLLHKPLRSITPPTTSSVQTVIIRQGIYVFIYECPWVKKSSHRYTGLVIFSSHCFSSPPHLCVPFITFSYVRASSKM